MDQVAAQRLGDATKFRSLVVSDNTVPAHYDTNLSYISYSAASARCHPSEIRKCCSIRFSKA